MEISSRDLSVTECLGQGLVVHSDDQVTAAQDKESSFVEDIDYWQGLSFDWGIA